MNKLLLTFLFSIGLCCFYAQNQDLTLKEKVLEMDRRIRGNPQLQVGGIDPNTPPSLPIGIVKEIGETKYIVAVDSAIFRPDGAHFSAYMALDFPRSDKKLAFAAKNIEFNPAGVLLSQGARLELVNNESLQLGPNVTLHVQGGGQTFVEFDCNGYKRTKIKGVFEFSDGILQPTTPGATSVTAVVDAYVEDVHNLIASVSFSPFAIRGLEDYKFAVSNATVDLSDYQNPSTTIPMELTQGLDGDLDLWRGFYLQNLTVTMPEKFNKESNNPTSFGVNNLFIDDAGITGDIFANNVVSLGDKVDASGWGLTISNIQLNLVANSLVGGSMAGKVSVASLDDNSINYTASVISAGPEDLDYTFSAGLSSNQVINVQSLKSEVTIYPTTILTVTDVNVEDKFKPSLNLNGKITVDNGTARFQGLSFQNVNIITERPFITGGSFSLTTSGASVANFGVSLDNIAFNYIASSERINLKFDVGITFGNSSTGVSFGASTTVNVEANTVYPGSDDRHIQFHKVRISDINLLANTTAFYLQGLVSIREDDPVFGKLFYGAIAFRLKTIMQNNATLRAGFGKTSGSSGYKYWYVDGQVPVNITLGQIKLNKLLGGASYAVESNTPDNDLLAMVNNPVDPNAPIPFTPNSNYGLTFKAGVGLEHLNGQEVLNGDAIFQVAFNSNGGFQSFAFQGDCYMLVKTDERHNPNVRNRVFGQLAVNYNNTTKTFQADINAQLDFAQAVTGNLNVDIFVDPNDWYVWFNTPTQRASVAVYKGNTTLFTASSYFQFGTVLSEFASLPSWTSSIPGINNATSGRSSSSAAQAATGNGLLVGMAASAGLNKEWLIRDGNKNWYYAYANIGFDLGFDLMIIKYSPNAVCSETGSSFGMNHRYATGQLYFRGTAQFGGKKVKKSNGNTSTFNLADLQLKALLNGRFPKPTYLEGMMQASITFLGINFGTFNFQFDMGQYCSIVY